MALVKQKKHTKNWT